MDNASYKHQPNCKVIFVYGWGGRMTPTQSDLNVLRFDTVITQFILQPTEWK